MKVRMKSLYCTATLTVQPDQVHDFPDDVAQALIAGKYALPVDDDPSRPDDRRPAKKAVRGKKTVDAPLPAASEGE